MKTLHSWLKLTLGVAMLVLLASCVSYVAPTDSTVGNMSVKEARKVLAAKLKNKAIGVDYDWKWHEITDVRVLRDRMIVTESGGQQSVFVFSALPSISYDTGTNGCSVALAEKNAFGACWQTCSTCGDTKDIANALYVLKQYPIKAKADADKYDANFAASLSAYRNKAASNTALSEEANKYKVQAEGAVRDKQFDDAADLYAEALKIAPWWPVGHFNRALVLGEIGDYGEAMREMKRYLQLVPDAPNASAAQNKIYDWERLDSK